MAPNAQILPPLQLLAALAINCEHLLHYSSNFTAEALAICFAVEYISQHNQKFVICTDSLSTIMTIKNPNYDPSLISKIRNICIKNFNKIKILWTPSHVGIEGNEQADKVAAEAKKRPLQSIIY